MTISFDFAAKPRGAVIHIVSPGPKRLPICGDYFVAAGMGEVDLETETRRVCNTCQRVFEALLDAGVAASLPLPPLPDPKYLFYLTWMRPQ